MGSLTFLLAFAARRLGQALLVAITISTLCFCLVRTIPGDLALRVANARYGEDFGGLRGAELVRAETNLSQPLLTAF